MDGPVQHVTIVGGGTAGWLAAITLQARLNGGRRPPSVKITLIESPNVKIIGVGEGTVPAFPKLMRSVGIQESELAMRCNATFKFGVRFDDWNVDDQGVPYGFTHPFRFCGEIAGRNSLNYYLAFGAHQRADGLDVADSLSPIPEAIRLKRCPRAFGAEQGKSALDRYAYHFDAVRLAEFLKEKSVSRGVEHIVDDVDEVILGDNGFVTQLRLRERGLLPVEFVIDCTGFKGLIISQTLKEPFLPYSQHLLCDRAVPLQIPYGNTDTLEACTRATALGAGWVWRVPLFNRIGTGYVFSSAFRSDEEAIVELTRHLGVDRDKVDPKVIPMRIGRLRNGWVANCVAIGLSSGFVEPLEATAIMTIQTSVRYLLRNFPSRSMPAGLRQRYNRTIASFHDSIRDFIAFHYFLSNRSDPFWLAAREPAVAPDSLAENLDVWRHRLPNEEDVPKGTLFSEMSYGICLAAKGFYRDGKPPVSRNLPAAPWQTFAENLGRSKSQVQTFPSAREYLAGLRGESPAPQRQPPDIRLVV